MRDNSAGWQIVWGLVSVAFLITVAYHGSTARSAYARVAVPLQAEPASWQHLSSDFGHFPTPSASAQQVLALVADLNNDSLNDFVIGSRRGNGPSVVWYRRDVSGWTRFVIETESLQLEAGGAIFDIDGDGDSDVVAGSNAQSNEIWWWENPYPDLNPATDWTRRFIKNSGADKHHDMMFGNFDEDPDTEFVYWNQNAKALFINDIPATPLLVEPWPAGTIIYNAPDNKREGLTQADVDGDGKSDIIGGGYWFKHTGGMSFSPNLIEEGLFMRVAAGQIIPGGRPEIVQVPGDASGMGRWFEWNGVVWIGRDLPIGRILYGHSLELADVDGDGNLDIFVGEMRYADGNNNSNPNARAMLLYGDGQGNFTIETVAIGFSHHESRLADLDGDGDIDILGKPFTWDTPRLDIWLNGESGSSSPTATATPSVCVPLARWQTNVVDNNRPELAVFVGAADLNGDDLKDIVAGGWWYRNPGSPSGPWERFAVGASFDQLAVLHDFDNDGDIDLLGTTWDGANPGQKHKGDEFVWARNDGWGNFSIYDNIQAGNGDFLQGALVESFRPGTRQIILSWHNGTPVQSLTIPANPFADQWTISTISTQSQGEDLSAGDIDGDGDLDLLLGTIWLENDNGNWIDHQLFATSNKADRNRLADINGDGRLDAVVGYEAISQPGKLAWYEAPANPAQLWTEHVIDTIIGPMSLDVADLDGDGDIDIVAGEHNKANPSQGRIFAYENNGGTFLPHLIASGDEHHDGAQLVDIDNDGDLDVVSIGWTHGRVLVYEQTGCPEEPVATDTPDPEATATENPTATGTPAIAPTATPAQTPTATPPQPTGDELFIYVSSTSGGTANGISFAEEDIMRLDPATGAWYLYFDGSDVGLTGDVDAFHRRDDGSLLLSTDTEQKLPGLGKVDDSDIVVFTPHTLGPDTAGEFSLYFDGSDVGLATTGEDVNGLAETSHGHLIISTFGNAAVPGLSGKKWDLLLFTPAVNGLGPNTAGTWSLYLKGSAIDLSASSEGVAGVSLAADGRLYLNTKGNFKVGTISGGTADVFECMPAALGENARCSPPPGMFWRGSANGFSDESIDALAVSDQ